MLRHFLPCFSPGFVVLFTLIGAAFPYPVKAHGDLHEQIQEMTKRIKQHPNTPHLYLKRAELHRAHRDWKAALADYDTVRRLNPSEPEVDFYRGRMLLEAARFSEARDALDRFLGVRPDHAPARVARARALARLGRHTEAAEDFTRALDKIADPTPDLYIERATALARGVQGVEAALKSLEEATGKLGPVITLQLAALDLEVNASLYDEALSRIDQIASTTARKETWLVRKGDILIRAGRKEEARQEYAAALQAIESLPAHRRNTRTIADLEQKIGKQLKEIAKTK